MRGERGQVHSELLLSIIVVVLVIAGLYLILSLRIVDQGETCVIVRLGDIVGTARTGPSLALRLVNRYVCYERRGLVYQTAANAQGKADFMDYPITANTSDGQQIEITANTTFFIKPENAEFVYENIGQTREQIKERIVANFTRSLVRDIAPNYRAEDLYTSGRVEFEKEIEGLLADLFEERGVTLSSFRLRSIVFDPEYVTAIENQQIAQEQVETRQYEAEQAVYEAERNRELAKGDAAATVERARGDAESRIIDAKAEAESIALRGEAIRQNPEILTLEFIQQLESANYLVIPWDEVEPFIPLDIMDKAGGQP